MEAISRASKPRGRGAVDAPDARGTEGGGGGAACTMLECYEGGCSKSLRSWSCPPSGQNGSCHCLTVHHPLLSLMDGGRGTCCPSQLWVDARAAKAGFGADCRITGHCELAILRKYSKRYPKCDHVVALRVISTPARVTGRLDSLERRPRGGDNHTHPHIIAQQNTFHTFLKTVLLWFFERCVVFTRTCWHTCSSPDTGGPAAGVVPGDLAQNCQHAVVNAMADAFTH